MKRLLSLMLMMICPVVWADSGAYRVEVIVFKNLAVTSDIPPAQEFGNFSAFPDLLEADLPDDLNVAEQISTYMDGVWRRLSSSQGYRPLKYVAWEQNRTDYYPPMRLHDDVIVDEQLRPLGNIMIADLVAEDPLAAYLSTFYRLDGTLQLRRSRFLHLFLDLEFRDEKMHLESVTQNSFFTAEEPVSINSASYDIYSLQENRQIRSGQLQYFDTPYFGALVLVTTIAAE